MPESIRHTPGPWEIGSVGFEEGYANIWQADGEGKGEYIIGTVTDEEVGEETAQANARLIAAAPELLEALKDAVERMDRARSVLRGRKDTRGHWGMLETSGLQVAIAKATGG